MTVKLDDMAQVIGWKHDHQSGMTVVDGEIVEFPGGIPSDSAINTWAVEYRANKAVMTEIERLESQVTQRRIRDAGPDDAGGTQAGRDWMSAQNALIATERSKL